MLEWNRAIELIEENLTALIDVEQLARTALTSEYHFRRMFSSLAGMPLSEYIRRRRLTVATAEILSGTTVLDAAVNYGYGSGDAFARAFKAMHGITPSQARGPGAVLRSQPKLRFHLRIEGSTDMRHRIVQKGAFSLVGVRTRIPIVHEGANPAIVEFMRSLDPAVKEQIAALSDTEPAGPLAVTDKINESRAEGTEADYWHAAATAAPAPEGLEQLKVPAGLWVVFEAEGKLPEALQQLWAGAATEWFPANPSYRWIPGPELLRVHPSPGGTEGSGQLWLPVEHVS